VEVAVEVAVVMAVATMTTVATTMATVVTALVMVATVPVMVATVPVMVVALTVHRHRLRLLLLPGKTPGYNAGKKGLNEPLFYGVL